MAESFFAGAGALRGAYEAVDWSTSPLGPVESWSSTLRAVLGMAWRTRFPVTLFWGPQQVLLYNEAYVPLILDKHPHALGSTTRETFPEVWDTIGPMIAGVMAGGEPVWVQDAHLPLRRRGEQLEDAWFTFSYSAVHGPEGVIEGAIDIATETTEQVLGQRRLAVLADVSAALADADDEQHAARTVLQQGLRALGCDGGAVHLLEGSTGQHRAPDDATREHDGDLVGPEPGPHVDVDGEGAELLDSVVAVDGVMTTDTLHRAVGRATRRAVAEKQPVGVSGTSSTESAAAGTSGAVDVAMGGAAWSEEEDGTESSAVDAVVLPLVTEGGVLGVMTAAWSRPQYVDAVALAPLRAVAAQYTEAVQRVRARRAEQASTARAAHITESMAVGYLSMNAQWRITYVNAEGRRVLGAAGADLTGQVLWELFPATVGTQYETHYRRAVATGQVIAFDAFYPAPLNAWFEIRATPEGEGLALYFLDITDRHNAEQARATTAQRLAGLGGVALAMTEADTMTDLVRVVAEEGFAALGCDGGSIALPDPDAPEVMVSYITTSFDDARDNYSRLHRDLPLPLCVAASTGRPALYPDREACLALSAELMPGAMEATGSQAFASLPMHAGGQLVGVLTAGWAQPQPFDAEQLELLGSLAAQCAQALQRLAAREAERSAAHAARTAASRQAALVAIAQALAGAQDRDDVLDVLADQGTALLGANGCGICLRSPDGAHVDTIVTDSYNQVRHTVQRVPADFPLPAIRSAATGQPIFMPDRTATEAAFPGSEAIYAGAGVQASAALPLRAREHLLGCLSVGFAQAREWTGEERGLLAAFAALTAQALERIAAHNAEQAALAEVAGIAETLQRSMLTPPPEPNHLEVVVRYTAAAQAAEVGGDWYDAFITADGQTTLVIGDVTGHDMRAAAVMGQLRNLLRGIGFTLGEPPARVLAALDRAAAGLGIDTVATAILAQVEQDEAHRAAGTRLLRWSNAGHPPPLLIEADGAVRYLDEAPDLVLGWDPSVERFDHELVLAPGATVLLYTDGLIERRRASLQDGLGWLAGAAVELAHASVEELCDGLLAQVEGHLDDDVALVALRAHPEDAPRPPEAGPSRVPSGLPGAQQSASQSE